MSKKFLLLIVLIFILVLGVGAFILNSNETSDVLSSSGIAHTITFNSEDGYSPTEITVNRGDTVIFKNNSDKHFWPASDIHPTHGIYPEFDPQDAVPAGDSWSFKFDKTGTWRFHDHLAPYFTGRITVE